MISYVGMDNLPKLHTSPKLVYDTRVQEVERHFVQDLGARPQHEANKEYHEEDVGEIVTVMCYKTLETMKIG